MDPRALRYPLVLLTASSPLLTSGVSSAAQEKKPNLVLMLADNLGYGDPGCYGGGETRGFTTPRLDDLATQSVRFTQFCVEPGSTPSRAALMTGRYSIRSGLSLIIVPGTSNTLAASEVTLAEVLKDAGYTTAMYGKWHLGMEGQSQPQNQGFDEWYGILNSTDETYFRPTMETFRAPKLPEQELPQIVQAKQGGKLEVVKPYTFETRRTIDVEIADRSVTFIKKQAKAGQPFFLYIPWTRPHFPNYTTAEFEGKSRIGRYGDSVMELDRNTGRVLDALREAGIEDNTIVVFCSDNGPMRETVGIEDGGFAGPYRGELGDPTEGSIRTVGLIKWPGRMIPRATNEMFSIMDFYPTLAKLAGATVPTDRPIDGVDQSEFLLGPKKTGARDNLLTFIGSKLVAIRWHQFRIYNYDVMPTGIGPARVGGMYAVLTPLAGYSQIFNIELDPREEHNMATQVGWMGRFVMPVIMRYKASLRDHPNPPAPSFTE